MVHKLIDFSKYQINPTDPMIRQVFFKDQDLRFIFLVLNNHEPLTISQLSRQFNKTFSTGYPKVWFYDKLTKIEHFGLFEKKPFKECSENGNTIDLEIIKKHKEWLLTQPEQFYKRYMSNEYIYLTKKGISWVDKVDEIQQRFKQGED